MMHGQKTSNLKFGSTHCIEHLLVQTL